MPIHPGYAENLAGPILDLYADAERLLLERIARALAAEMDAPDWAERKLIQIQLLQAYASGMLRDLQGKSTSAIAEAVLTAYNRGTAMAVADLAKVLETGRVGAPGLPAVERLVTEAVGNTAATHGRILRTVDDVFRQVVARSAPQVLLGTQTRREAAQAALDEFATRGITGFVDRAGRRWDMASYVEMATRTAVGNAAVQGHVDRLQAAGQDLVVVSDAPQECSVCRDWEGKVLSLSGVRHVGVDVAGTLSRAKSAGLFHPGCRHSISIFIPGVTETSPHGKTDDPQGDADRQRLREMERHVRAWKRRQAVAMTPEAEKAAGAKVRDWQAAIREHTATTSAKRIPARERLGTR